MNHVIGKMLAGTAMAVGFCAGGAAPAGADPNPFGTLDCSCQEAAPADSPPVRDEIDRGLREGHSAPLPGLPAPAPGSTG